MILALLVYLLLTCFTVELVMRLIIRIRGNMIRTVPPMETIIARASEPEQEILHDKAANPNMKNRHNNG